MLPGDNPVPNYQTQNTLLPLKALASKGLITVKRMGRVPPSQGRRGSIVEAQLLVHPSQVHIAIQNNRSGPQRSMYESVEGEEHEPPLGQADQFLDRWERHWTRICGNKRFDDHPKAMKSEIVYRAPPPVTWLPSGSTAALD